ncbi:unnamed protein product, partial [marine sediment metagenome]
SGQLGLGHYNDIIMPTKMIINNVKQIICGAYHTLAITYKNEIYAWGSGENIPTKIVI